MYHGIKTTVIGGAASDADPEFSGADFGALASTIARFSLNIDALARGSAQPDGEHWEPETILGQNQRFLRKKHDLIIFL